MTMQFTGEGRDRKTKQREDLCSHPASIQNFEVTTTLGNNSGFYFTTKHPTDQKREENMCLNVVGETQIVKQVGFLGFF